MRNRILFAAGLFGMILGAKWALVALYGTELPLWDQWDAEARMLLQPWFDGGFGDFARALFYPQNEHRVVWTKLLALAEVLVNGQWDARLQSTVNAGIAAALATGAWYWLAGLATRTAARAGLFAAVLGLAAPPVSWQNLIGGFHSQQILLVGFSSIAIVLSVGSTVGSRRWWLGALVAVAAFFTMGSGFLAAAVILGAAGWDAYISGRLREFRLPLIAIALVVAAGFLLRVEAAQHEDLKAHGLGDFVLTFWRSLQWPVTGFAPYALIAWAPWGILAWGLLRRRGAAPRNELALAALGGWVLIQFLATAYARGAEAEWPASRYLDTLATGLLVNAGSLAVLACRPGLRGRAAYLLVGLAAAWAIPLALGLRIQVGESVRTLIVQKGGQMVGEAATQAYLATGNPVHLRTAGFIPYPSADDFIDRIAPTSLRKLLPASVRPEITVKPFRVTGFNQGTFGSIEAPHTGGMPPAANRLAWRKYWGSWGPEGAATIGEFSSEPIDPPAAGWLKFETAGDVGEPGMWLELRDPKTNEVLATINPTRVPHDTWRAAYVRSPKVPYIIVATDTDTKRWLAFSAPVEMASLSHFAWRVAANGMLIFWISGGLTAVFTLAAFARRKRIAT